MSSLVTYNTMALFHGMILSSLMTYYMVTLFHGVILVSLVSRSPVTVPSIAVVQGTDSCLVMLLFPLLGLGAWCVS